MKNGKKYLFNIIFAATSISLVIGSTITYAAYVTAANIGQQTGYLGKFDQDSIFLNANIWEKDDPVYYMYRFNDSTPLNAGIFVAPSKVITPVIGDVNFTLYVFEYDKTLKQNGILCNKYLFYRLKPQVSGKTFSTTASTTYKIHNYTSNKYFELYQHEADSNHYIARHIEFSAGDQFKVEDISVNPVENYYGNNEMNVVVGTAGTYTIDFYVTADNDIHIVITNESFMGNFKWNQTCDITYSSTVNYICVNSWDDNFGNHNSGIETKHLELDSNDNLSFSS